MAHHTQVELESQPKGTECGELTDVEYVGWDGDDLVLGFTDSHVLRIRDIRLAVKIGLDAQEQIAHA